MAPSVSSAGILRLPPVAAALFFSAVFGLTSGHVLPRQTKTVELHELNVVPFPRPTEAPDLLSDLLLRRQGQNTVCGFIGGDPNLPATCSAGSHCVLEQDHDVVGCCPDGGSCSTGIFTGCVDRNSDLQTEINPYVYTCQGTDVCYKNRFAGGYFQFGCGTASSLGTTVETSVDGMTSLVFEETTVSLTALPSVLTEPTSIGSLSGGTSIGSQPSSATDDPDLGAAPSGSDTISPTSSELSADPSVTADPLPTSESSPAPPESSSAEPWSQPASSVASSSSFTSPSSSSSSISSSSSLTSSSTTLSSSITSTSTGPSITSSFGTETPTDSSSPTSGVGANGTSRGAIIGGSITGAAILVAIIVVLAFFFRKKRRGNDRQGPGPLPTDAPPRTGYISPMKSHGAAFAPLPSWQDEEEDRRPLTRYTSQPYRPLPEPPTAPPTGPLPPPPPQAQKGMAPIRTVPTNRAFPQPLRYHPPTIRLVPPRGVGGAGLTPVAEEENPHDQDSSSSSSSSSNSNSNSNSSDREYEAGSGRGPTPSEIDDFSRAYMSAGIGTQDLDEDRLPLRSDAESPGGSCSPPRSSSSPGNRPLWQQNRQQGRNLMWM
ncbi:uncharacterized protein F4812DRAFT_424937 [Daldinia caldariorum]|uniref:uncharacterized protein n=1 Tax=Daldinia caldariorum TaxID=326644 RepID=UPI0020077AF0|nr:uncharacterized protein F4812DRAFT_424937 [Daldinia caldariorum]KAI1468862.1 hypothetical protein F4812DRAFT_424937 [Daldinia caldariorum]